MPHSARAAKAFDKPRNPQRAEPIDADQPEQRDVVLHTKLPSVVPYRGSVTEERYAIITNGALFAFPLGDVPGNRCQGVRGDAGYIRVHQCNTEPLKEWERRQFLRKELLLEKVLFFLDGFVE